MFKNMADGRSCKDEDAGAVQNQILRSFGISFFEFITSFAKIIPFMLFFNPYYYA
ncbi:MAG TPA: hypothetical protein VFU89_01565 [Rhabdochlamydiaceae bacterium]|nr:hypothetical protein [Rhabdochlamydiaceae bacterium]